MIGYFQGIFVPYGFIHRILRHGGRADPIFFFRIIRYPFNERLTFGMHQFIRGSCGAGYFTSIIDNLVIIGGLAIFLVVIISTGVGIGLQTCPAVSYTHLFQKIGQPTVIGEIVAGIVLGPSVLGHLLPEASGFLFPVESLANITILSQFGLILFMLSLIHI